MRNLIALAVMVMLVGCARTEGANTAVVKFTETDLRQARDVAVAGGNAADAQCWAAYAKLIAPLSGAQPGLATTIEAKRGIQNLLSSQACFAISAQLLSEITMIFPAAGILVPRVVSF